MFRFFHGYHPETWDAQVKSGLVGADDGIRFCQFKRVAETHGFNRLAARQSQFHRFVEEHRCPFYIDRLQGGTYIDDYAYDEALLNDYRDMIGDGFWGFQMHEWFSNYRSDLKKLQELDEEHWTEEEIVRVIREKFKVPMLFLECMRPDEMAAAGKPRNVKEFYKNMTDIYRKRRKQVGDIVPCDSGFLAYPFEIANGARHFMPEIGAQTPDAKVQICYARGMAAAHNITFGAYYEPWGGNPFSTCCYQKDGRNEFGIRSSNDSPFAMAGANGGSSRSLQRRLYLYAFLSGAEFISEEWGLCNTFVDWNDFELSDYGKVNLEFLNFARKYRNIGRKLAPAAVVLPRALTVLDEIHNPRTFCGYELEGEDGQAMARIKDGICKVFSAPTEMLGTEQKTLINSDMPDAIDLLNECGDHALKKYSYLIDLTEDPAFAAKHPNCCSIEDLPHLLRKELPCYVDGGLHWLVNECTTGGYYLSVFNHSGISRTVADGEQKIAEAEKTVAISFKQETVPAVMEGEGTLFRCDDGTYRLTVPAGGWCLMRF